MGARAANNLKNTACPVLNQANQLPALSDDELEGLAQLCPHLQRLQPTSHTTTSRPSHAAAQSTVQKPTTHSSSSRPFNVLDALASGAAPPGPVARWMKSQQQQQQQLVQQLERQQEEEQQASAVLSATPLTLTPTPTVPTPSTTPSTTPSSSTTTSTTTSTTVSDHEHIGTEWFASNLKTSTITEYNHGESINAMVQGKYIENRRVVGTSTEELFNRVGYKTKEQRIIGHTPEEYNSIFQQKINDIQGEGRYRIFANLARQAGNFPYADHRKEDGSINEVVAWCSNDYLGMGEHQKVLNAMKTVVDECGAGAGGTRNIAGTNKYHVRKELGQPVFSFASIVVVYILITCLWFLLSFFFFSKNNKKKHRLN